MTVEDVARKMLELKILPRFMMLVFTGVYIYCILWFTGLSADEATAERAALISVVTGAATGSLAVWLNSEKSS
jgi:hypothetical protein